MAPVATSNGFAGKASSPSFKALKSVPSTLLDALTYAKDNYSQQSLMFISTSGQTSKATTYGEFIQSVYSLAQVISTWKRPVGSVVVVYLTEHEDNMAAFWACVLCGLVPCLQPSLSTQDDHRRDHIAHIQKTLVSPIWLTNVAGADQIRGDSELDIKLISQLRSTAHGAFPAKFVPHKPHADDDALLLLTSGSTGFSKAVVHTHRTILAGAAAKGLNYGLTSHSKILNWVGFDHVAGSVEMHITPFLYGAFQLHVNASVIMSSSEIFLKLIEEHNIDFTFAPNFLFAKVVKELGGKPEFEGTYNLSSLRRINSGGEAVVTSTAKAFVDVLTKVSYSGLSFSISPGFGMTETCAGCIYNSVHISSTSPAREFMDLGYPIAGIEMRIVDPADGVTSRPDGESGELQLRGPMLFKRYYNNNEATEASIIAGGWYRTGDLGIIENGSLRLSGRIKDTLIVHGVSHGIPELETHLQNVKGVAHSYLCVAPYRAPGQDTEGFIVFFSPTFSLTGEDAAVLLNETHRNIRDTCTRMITLPPTYIVPIPVEKMEKSTLGKLSRARLTKQFQSGVLFQYLSLAEALIDKVRSSAYVKPEGQIESAIAELYAGIFDLEPSKISATENFFELGGTSIDLIRLKSILEKRFGLPELPIIKILSHPVLRDLAEFVAHIQEDGGVEYDPIVPLQLTGNKTPIFFVHPGVGEVLIFVNLAKYFQNERPFYALRARGFDEGQPMFTSMNEMATTYAQAIMRTQKKGPYALAGYSYGGVVAFETAKLIEAQGHEVKFVGLVNIPPHINDRMQEITDTAGMLNLAYFLGLLSKQEALDIEPKICHLSFPGQIGEVWKIAPPERIAELQLTPAKLQHWVAIARSLIECGKDYTPSGNVAALNVFYAIPLKGTKEDWLNKMLRPWKNFSRSDVVFTDVPGQHYTLMDINHVSQFQRHFRARLEERGL